MTDKKVKELANEIFQAYIFDYVDVDVTKAAEIIRKYIPKDTVLVNLDQYHKWQDEMCEMKREIVRLNQTITPAKIRQETAKEILQELKKKEYTNNYCQEIILLSELDELAKRYGVEIEQ